MHGEVRGEVRNTLTGPRKASNSAAYSDSAQPNAGADALSRARSG